MKFIPNEEHVVLFLYTVAFRSIRAIPICLSYVRGMPLLRNIQTTYLTGLSIEMTPIQGTGDILVNIRWDDYNITNDTRWTGKISLKDTAKMGNLSRLIVRPGGKLIVDGGTLTSACPNELWLSYPTRTRSITDNVSHFTNSKFIVSKYCRD